MIPLTAFLVLLIFFFHGILVFTGRKAGEKQELITKRRCEIFLL
jgi:hypothetical protein